MEIRQKCEGRGVSKYMHFSLMTSFLIIYIPFSKTVYIRIAYALSLLFLPNVSIFEFLSGVMEEIKLFSFKLKL